MSHHSHHKDSTSRFRDSMRQRQHKRQLIGKMLWWGMLSIAIIVVVLVIAAYLIDRN